jgi:hypothetical protein
MGSTAAPIRRWRTGWSDPVAGRKLHPLKNQHLSTAHTKVCHRQASNERTGQKSPSSVRFHQSLEPQGVN